MILNTVRRFFLVTAILATVYGRVNHIIIFYDGSSEVTFIDSMTNTTVYCTNENEKMEFPLSTVYFIYNDYNKMFYKSPSLKIRMDYIERYGGELVTVRGDTIVYNQVKFNRAMRDPMVYITTPADSFIAVPFLDIYQMNVDYAFMQESVKKGFLASFGGILFTTGMQIFFEFLDIRQPGQNFAAIRTAVWHQTKDLLPRAEAAGLHENGVTYQSLTFLLPVTTVGWMVYDYFFEWRSNYFRPLTTRRTFPKPMKVVTIRSLLESYLPLPEF
ncbi:MAG: hypothetical protein ACE5D8_09885 [Fidelibacterota bacterium]